MLDNILGVIKNTVSNGVKNNNIVPDDKKEQTVETTTNALAEGIKQNINPGNLGNIMSLFGKKSASGTTGNPITSSIQNTVSNSLVQQVGLSPMVATAVAAAVVPMVMNAISGKVNDPNDKDINMESLLNSFGGGKGDNLETAGKTGGILGGLGKIFK